VSKVFIDVHISKKDYQSYFDEIINYSAYQLSLTNQFREQNYGSADI